MLHTQEPWDTDGTAVYQHGYGHIAIAPRHKLGTGGAKQSELNLRRIVACVNACQGINPEVVPEMVGVLEKIQRVFEETAVILNQAQQPAGAMAMEAGAEEVRETISRARETSHA